VGTYLENLVFKYAPNKIRAPCLMFSAEAHSQPPAFYSFIFISKVPHYYLLHAPGNKTMLLIKTSPARRPQFLSLILPFTNTSLQTPYFSTSSIPSAAAARSPRVRAAQRRQQQLPPPQQHQQQTTTAGSIPRPKSTQWPTVVIQAASKSGEISISAQAAEAILDDFMKLDSSQSAGGLCSR
jgi:hypothetical protein